MRLLQQACAVILLCTGWVNSGLVLADEPVVLAVDDYPPYIDQNRLNLGVLTEQVQRLLSQAHIPSSIQFAPWARVEHLIDNERVLSFMWFKNDERARNWVFSDPLTLVGSVLLARADLEFDGSRVAHLARLRVGVTRGYSYGAQFDGILNRLLLEQSASDYQGLQKLVAGRIDVLVIDPHVANDMLAQYFAKEAKGFKQVGSALLAKAPVYLVCSKRFSRCAGIIDKFNQQAKGLPLLAVP